MLQLQGSVAAVPQVAGECHLRPEAVLVHTPVDIGAFGAIDSIHDDELESKAQLSYALYKHRSEIKRSYEDVDKAIAEF